MGVIEQVLGEISFFSIPNVGVSDVVDILVVAFFIYKLLIWIKDTRTWTLLRGVIVVIVVAVVAYVFQLNTVWLIVSNAITLGTIAVLVLFQPELRRALEQIGRGRFLNSIMNNEEAQVEGLSEETTDALVKACVQMAKVKTGALIVLEQGEHLSDVERTGIPIDAIVTSQLLINIFEKNTPLHDGAVVIANNRVTAATCFLPLTDSLQISKELGTRHRAAIGLSEVTDAMVVVVSEETGAISFVKNGKIRRWLDSDALRRILTANTNRKKNERKLTLWKGRQKDA